MRNFLLNLNDSYTIQLFSISHIILIVTTLLLVAIVIYNKEKISNLSEKNKKIIRYTFGTILILNIIIRRGSFIYYGVYDWQLHLDINFCSFTSIMFIIYCLSGNKNILNIGYHMAFIGPLLSIILPSYNLLPNSYSFCTFILIHHIIFIFNFIFIFMNNLKWNKKLFSKVIEFLVIYYTVIFVFDYCFDVAYNNPLAFINDSIINTPFMSFLVSNNIIMYISYFLVIIGLSSFGNIILKHITRNNNYKKELM